MITYSVVALPIHFNMRLYYSPQISQHNLAYIG